MRRGSCAKATARVHVDASCTWSGTVSTLQLASNETLMLKEMSDDIIR